MSRNVFVFASNLAGAHGGGSARAALEKHGAILGEGIGYHGNSYAIPTLDRSLVKLALHDIAAHVGDFLEFAKTNTHMTFEVVAIGCGIAGFKAAEIAPMFAGAPTNCILPREFTDVLDRIAA